MNRREKVLFVLDSVKENELDFDVQVEQERPYTFVKIVSIDAEKAGTPIWGRGFSKVCFPDRWNPERGVQIAMAKAASNLIECAKDFDYDKNDAH